MDGAKGRRAGRRARGAVRRGVRRGVRERGGRGGLRPSGSGPADAERAGAALRGSGPRGTEGTASLGQPGGKDRLAGSPIDGAVLRCVSAAERKGRCEAGGVEGERHAALVPGGSGGTESVRVMDVLSAQD